MTRTYLGITDADMRYIDQMARITLEQIIAAKRKARRAA